MKRYTPKKSELIIQEMYRERYYNYLTRKRHYNDSMYDRNTISKIDSEKIELALMLHKLRKEKRRIFHLIITYKKYERDYSEKDVNTFFKNIFLHSMLPKITSTRRRTSTRQKMLQPICFAFVDEHKRKHSEIPFSTELDRLKAHLHDSDEEEFPLHHHAIVAVHPEQYDSFKELIGENTLINSHPDTKIIKTSYIIPCEPMRILYASKKLKKYPNYMLFPNTNKRRNNTNKIYDKTDKNLRNIVSTRIHLVPNDINSPYRIEKRNKLA
jgi:hypothetical protein